MSNQLNSQSGLKEYNARNHTDHVLPNRTPAVKQLDNDDIQVIYFKGGTILDCERWFQVDKTFIVNTNNKLQTIISYP